MRSIHSIYPAIIECQDSYVRGITIDLRALEDHELLPANVIGVVSDEGRDEDEPDAPVRALITHARERLAGHEAAIIG